MAMNLATSKLDRTGRVYLPREVREAAGLRGEAVVEVRAEKNRIVLVKKEKKVARGAKGIFRLRGHVKDVDIEIRKASGRAALRELDEIRRR